MCRWAISVRARFGFLVFSPGGEIYSAGGFELIDTDGERVGQVNGLSVVQLGDFAFGRPSRITARVHLGSGQVVDIER